MRVFTALLALMVCGCLSANALAQQAAPGTWGGWARCEVTVAGPGYADHQTHTWKMSGGAPTVQGAFRIYPGTWSVVGRGSLTRTQGNQSLQAQWATNGPETSAPIAVFVRASDGRMFIQSRHAQMRSNSAIRGFQQQTISGVPQIPVKIDTAAFEWGFPQIAVSAAVPPSTNMTASGSSTTPSLGSVGVMQPAGSAVTATCHWQFGQGSAAPAPPPVLAAQPVPTPGSLANNPPPSAPVSNPPPASGNLPTSPPTLSTTTTPGAPGVTPPPGTAVGAAPPDSPASSSPPILSATPLPPTTPLQLTVCSLRGPGRPASDAANYATPRRAHLRWEAVGGATGYVVSRSGLGDLTPQPLSENDTSWEHDSRFLDSGTYVYTVMAIYRDGRCGKTDFAVKRMPLKTPPVTVRVGTQPGSVSFQWNWPSDSDERRTLNDYTGLLITGPALPPQGHEVERSGTPAEGDTINGVPAGRHTWTLKAYWRFNNPVARITDNTGTTVTVVVP